TACAFAARRPTWISLPGSNRRHRRLGLPKWSSDRFRQTQFLFWNGRRRDWKLRFFLFQKLVCDSFSVVQKFFRAEIHQKICRTLSPRSIRERRSRNCCIPIWCPAQIFRSIVFRVVVTLRRREFDFPATRLGLLFFPPDPSNLHNPANRKCDSANYER